MNEDKIHFEPIKYQHLSLMLIWLMKPHVKEWWDKDIAWTPELVQEKFGSYIEGFKIADNQRKSLNAYIIYCDKEPVGYMQLYNAHEFAREDGIKIDDFSTLPSSLAAIDFFIGEESFLGKGLGSKILNKFFTELVDPFYDACFVDPESKNLSAIKTYEKSGFVPISDKEINNSIWMIRHNPNKTSLSAIKIVDLSKINEKIFKRICVGCIVLTENKKILLQQRPENWRTFPGCLATFGGGVESGEMPLDTLKRELNEELGAVIDPADVLSLGVFTEAVTNYSELIYAYFWQDKKGTITGCYECEPKYYDTIDEALKHPKIMEDVKWMLVKCKQLNLLG